MRLHDLLDATEVLEIVDDAPVAVDDITHDSRRVGPGALFCCIPGGHADGHRFAAAAVERGAGALLVDHAVGPLPRPVPQVVVRSVRRAIGPLAAATFEDPSHRMPVLGVTGTNGKTTTTFMLASILTAAGRRPAVIGTLGVRFGDEVLATGFTTPEAPDLQRTLAGLVADGADAVAMEVSSHALAQHRVDGTRFAAACFTNLSREHLDEHGTLSAYFAAKARLFTATFTDRAAVAVDDAHGARLVDLARAAGLCVRTYAVGAPDAAVRVDDVRPDPAGTIARVHGLGEPFPVRVGVPGRFNLANALAAATTASLVGVAPEAIAQGLAALTTIPGRFELIPSKAPFTVVVDYAHTPDGIRVALDSARELATGRVIAVFGCGGDRDPEKRPGMGEAAGRGADLVVLTSDNPRSEAPAAIAAMAAAGLDRAGARYTLELDRGAAIEAAVAAAGPGDVVMILGKGAETGQIVGTERIPFDDRRVAARALDARWS
ncbi:MAG: UDP-N-acetylmuramoyl-L-alanyl-D-glutamate--2,6-diaminopimelate ligase [Acidimicrobiia bacterium]